MLNGSLVALVTPYLEDGSINYSKLGELIEYHIDNNTDGIVILGTTGESSTISFEEQVEIVKYSISKINNRVPVIIGAGSNNTLEACKLAKTFSNLGADYLLVITPYYNKTNSMGLIKHFEIIAESSRCPIIMYNVPSRTGMNIPVDVVKILASNPNIYGIKEASGDLDYAKEIAEFLNEEFIMLSGNDDLIVPMMKIGAVGVISVLANICPIQVHNMCKLSLSKDYEEANIIQEELLEVANSLFYETNPIPIKAALNYLGFAVGGYRLPLYDMSEEAYNKMIKVLVDSKERIF